MGQRVDSVNLKPYQLLPAWLTAHERRVIETLSRHATWEEGRQKTGYEKSNLLPITGIRWILDRALSTLGNPSEFDAYLLRYPTGSEIPPHTDPAEEGLCHVRFNALAKAGTGGMLYLENQERPLAEGDAYLFRPDITEHRVDPLEAGERLVLSVGANIEPEHAEALGLA